MTPPAHHAKNLVQNPAKSEAKLPMRAMPATALRGNVRPASDKSISHRALILGALALGRTRIEALLESEDVLNTAACLAACGVTLRSLGNACFEVDGVGISGLAEPETVLDCGNSGTGARLLMGLLSGQAVTAFFTGDASLCRRPMGRVMEPLAQMGVQFFARSASAAGSGFVSNTGRLPLGLRGPDFLRPIDFVQSVASAQVKSAILLAGLNAPGETSVFEPQPSRDHSERMLRAFGAQIETVHEGSGVRHTLKGQPHLSAQNILVPADPSSAAFPLVAALLVPNSDIVLRDVGLNPLRTGLFTTLLEMGAEIEFLHEREMGGERVADLRVRHSSLRGVEVPASRAPSMIDEYPILAVAAAFAEGETMMRGLHELRVKESDRLAMMAAGLIANGVSAEIVGDDLRVKGGSCKGGGMVETAFDHRIAMSFLVMGLAAPEPIMVDDTSAIATSFPDFLLLMKELGASLDIV